MAAKTDLYQAKESFGIQLEGEQITVQAGDLVRSGHPILKQAPDLFEPAGSYVRFDVEQTTKAPGEKRGTKADAKK
jgi:hypothetical protein